MIKKTLVLSMALISLPGCVIAAKTTNAPRAADSIEECVQQCASQFAGKSFEMGDHKVWVSKLDGGDIEREIEVFLEGEEFASNDGERLIRIEKRGPNGEVDRWVGSPEDLPEGEGFEVIIDAEDLPHAPKGVKVIKIGESQIHTLGGMPAPAPRSTLTQELRDLGDAKREGLINDEEFSELRRAVLEKHKGIKAPQ